MFDFICILSVLKHKYATELSLLLTKYYLATRNGRHESGVSHGGVCLKVHAILTIKH